MRTSANLSLTLHFTDQLAMSTTQTVQLRPYTVTAPVDGDNRTQSEEHIIQPNDEPEAGSTNISSAIPDGGYGWVVVASCSLMTFWFNGQAGSWGVIQTALLSSSLRGTPTSTITFVGSLSLCCAVTFGLFGVRLISILGSRYTALLGMGMIGLGEIAAGFVTSSIGGLFALVGVLVGVGSCLIYALCNSIPPQYFSAKLGTANGIVKFGGGLGATVLSITLQALIDRVGTPWMFRILGIMTLATGLPAAYLTTERTPLHRTRLIDFSMFKNLPFVAIFLASAFGTFALFVPSYFLPLYAQSAGLSSQTGAALVAGFNACTAIGRLGAGWVCDRIGPMNTFLLTMALNAVSMLAIWPISNSLGPLTVFAIVNGVANGGFFVSLPTTVASMAGPGLAALAMSMNTTGFAAGYLLGTPIAGYLLQATGADKNTAIDLYRPAIFYAGGIALISSLCVLLARLKTDPKIAKRV